VQKSGTLVVGTSADYPPFAFYNRDQKLDGFDIALIQEIGRRLGLHVDIQDFAFDGLGGALQIGQIDTAIAAISYTPERDAFVDFSDVYFVSNDAVLAAEGGVQTIAEARALGGYRVGVQSGTVHEQWIQSTLIDEGLMDEDNLFIYQQADHAVTDLGTGYLDIVLLDSEVANTFEQVGDFAVIAEGLNQQLMALAVPDGADELRTRINRVLIEMRGDGSLVDLVTEYFDLEEEDIPDLPPPGTEWPPPPDVTPPGCINGLAHVADLTYDDHGMTVAPPVGVGQPFQKGWRVKNTGTCTWDSSYKVVYVGGNTPAARMGGVPTAVAAQVSPGQEYDMYVNLVAPVNPGVYQGFWQMTNGDGVPFGTRLWVLISAVSGATPVPLPTSTPSPYVTFTVDRTHIRQGECTTLRWSTSNVKAVYVYPLGEPWNMYPVVGTDTRQVCPSTTTVYEIRVIHRDDRVELRQVTVYVEQSIGAPIIQRFTLDPPNQIYYGDCVNVQWEVQGTVDRVTISRGSNTLRDPAPISGSLQDCPGGVRNYTYRILATGPGGSSDMERRLQVVEAPVQPTPTSTPVPAEPKPVINSFSVVPNAIEVNQCVQIAWDTGGGTTNVKLLRDGSVILDNAPLGGNTQDCLNSAGTKGYRLEARNRINEMVSSERSVTVSDAAPENPLANTSWQLTALNGQAPVGGVNVTAYFAADGGLSANGGCNNYSGSYTVSGSSLSIGPLSGTGMLCGDEIDQQEQAYVAALGSAATFQIGGGELVIKNSGGTEVLRYVQIVASQMN
jgi:polar amino acid transport system substrate-binding protein